MNKQKYGRKNRYDSQIDMVQKLTSGLNLITKRLAFNAQQVASLLREASCYYQL